MALPKQGGGSDLVKTCPAAMGFAFAAGTTDGPGAFDFKQGDNEVTCDCNIYVLNHCYSVMIFSGCLFLLIVVCCCVTLGKCLLETCAELLKNTRKGTS